MFRKNEACYFIKSPLIFKMDQLGIGMSVAMLPVILDTINRTGNETYIHCHKHHLDIIKYFINEDNIYPFYDSNNAELHHDKVFVGDKARLSMYFQSAVGVPPPHQCHPVDHFFHAWLGEINVDVSRKNYPKFPVEKVDISKFNLPNKFVVIGPGYTKPICQIPVKTIEDIIIYCKSKGYEVVLLGDNYNFKIKAGGKDMTVGPEFPSSEIFNDCINLVEKTKLDEAVAILDKAHCYVGPEGGLMQFCGMTNTPMVIGINGWHPDMRMPYRNNELGWECYPVVPDEDLECKFCIQKTFFAKTVNIMMECIYNDFKCVSQMHFNKFKFQLDKIL